MDDKMVDKEYHVGDIVLVQFNLPGTASGDGSSWNCKFIRTYAVISKVFEYKNVYLPECLVYIPPCEGPCGKYGGLEPRHENIESSELPVGGAGGYIWIIDGPYDALMSRYQSMTLEERELIKSARKKLGFEPVLDRFFWKDDETGIYRSSDGYWTQGPGCEVHPPEDKR